MKTHVKIVIVGGNAAGPAAAAKAKRFNPNAEVILYEAGEFISTGTCEMPYVITNDIESSDKLIFHTPSSFLEEKGVQVYIKHFVEEIDTKRKCIIVNDMVENKTKEVDYNRLILATGSKAKTIPGFNTSFKNVFTFKDINDLNNINDFIKTNSVQNAVVFGSGYLGIETAEVLRIKKINVKLLEKETHPMPSADIEFSNIILSILRENQIEFINDVKETEPVIIDDTVREVKINDRTIRTDLIIITAGFYPDAALAESAKLETGKHGGIKTDRYMKTSNNFIFAAGDNVEIINAITGKQDYFPLAANAYTLAHIAGENAAGGNLRYDPVVKNISVKIFNKYFASVGLNSKEAQNKSFDYDAIFAKARSLVKVMPGSEEVTGKVLVEKESRRILGAEFIGGKEVSGYADLISALIKLKAPADILAKINYNYTPPLSPFINLLSIIGKKVK